MADIEVRRDSLVSETTTKKTRKVKKTKRRESSDQGSEITITEIEQTTTENTVDQDQDHDEEGYVNEPAILFWKKKIKSVYVNGQFISTRTQTLSIDSQSHGNNISVARLSIFIVGPFNERSCERSCDGIWLSAEWNI